MNKQAAYQVRQNQIIINRILQSPARVLRGSSKCRLEPVSPSQDNDRFDLHNPSLELELIRQDQSEVGGRTRAMDAARLLPFPLKLTAIKNNCSVVSRLECRCKELSKLCYCYHHCMARLGNIQTYMFSLICMFNCNYDNIILS